MAMLLPRCRFLSLALFVAVLPGCAWNVSREQKEAIRQNLEVFRAALNSGSFAQLEPVLAPSMKMGSLPPDLSRAGLKESLSPGGKPITDLQILSLRHRPEGVQGTIALYRRNDALELPMTFAPDGRIQQIGHADEAPARVRIPDSMTVPFVTSGGLIFVRATVDAKEGYFLVDTGASDMLLNSRYFSGTHREEAFLPVQAGVHGVKASRGIVRVGRFEWGTFRIGNFLAPIRDLRDLETKSNTPLLGAIGYAQLHQSAMVVNWKNRTLSLHATDGRGARKVVASRPPAVVVPFSYDLHLPAFAAKVGNRSYTMLLDTGSSANLLPNTTGWKQHFSPRGRGPEISDGVDRVQVKTSWGLVDAIQLPNLTLTDVPILIHPIPYLGEKGILGAPLLSGPREIEINFVAQEMRLWE